MGNEEISTSEQTIVAYNKIPYSILSQIMPSSARTEFEQELMDILKLYDSYEKGSEFVTEGSNGDYIPATLRYKEAKSIMNKEVRFLFSNPPDIMMSPLDLSNKGDKGLVDSWQNLVDKVLKANNFNAKLLKSAKDCFIGKRVCLLMNFNIDTGIQVTFIPSTEFYYETDPTNIDVLTKVVTFQRIVQSKTLSNVRIFCKRYWMENGLCHVQEDIYDGAGKLIEAITAPTATLFPYIPAKIILNDGLTGDTKGTSEIKDLCESESWYSRLANADMDAERKSMNPTKWTMDCSPDSTSNLSTAAGAYWDLISDPNNEQGHQGQTGIIEPTMAYKEALSATLSRIQNNMYQSVDVPNTSSEALQGIITSGKTLKAIYWGLMVRCDEKMLAWTPALEFMVNCIYDGVLLYPECARIYTEDILNEVDYEVNVTNNYPLPDDEIEEKTVDMAEVGNQVMSRKAYMKKWRGLTDEEADEELHQILLEKQLFEESYANPSPLDKDEDLDTEISSEGGSDPNKNEEGTGSGNDPELEGDTDGSEA